MIPLLACVLLGLLHPMDGPDVDLRVEIEEGVVRLILAPNLAYLDETVETARENPDFVHPVEVGGLRDTLLEHWSDNMVVAIDGVRVDPHDVGFEVFDAEPSLLPMFPRMGRRALTRVEQRLEYPCKQTPARVEITWPDFPDDPQNPLPDGGFQPLEINGRMFALGRESLMQFSLRDPRFVWVRDEAERTGEPLPVPAPARGVAPLAWTSYGLLLAGAALALGLFSASSRLGAACVLVCAAGLAYALRPSDELPPFSIPDEAAALAAFGPLHANLYRAFDYTDESTIYDALARSAEGPLLDSLYQEVYESLKLEEDGGARSFVRSVDPLETSVFESRRYAPDDAPGFQVETRWQVEGQVFHWGHSHTRTNSYRAKYTVVATPDGWRLRASEVLEHERQRAANDTDDFPAAAATEPTGSARYDDL